MTKATAIFDVVNYLAVTVNIVLECFVIVYLTVMTRHKCFGLTIRIKVHLHGQNSINGKWQFILNHMENVFGEEQFVIDI